MPDAADLAALLAAAARARGRIVVLTGAGISAESGIPTFRGPEGYWRVGSTNFRPEQLATFAAFRSLPQAQWAWYLYRRGVCLAAPPNAAHQALVDLERALADRFVLVTQNVDGLHLRAGSSPARTLQIHGNLHFARCAAGCPGIAPLPADLGPGFLRDQLPDARTLAALHCPSCSGWLRPHVLWFDECYDEEHYRADSARSALDGAALLLVVGTSGATTLPARMVHEALASRIPVLVVDPEPTPFSALVERARGGVFARGTACARVPEIVKELDG